MLEFSILAGAAVKGSLVLGVASGTAWALRRRSAAARHLVWTAAAAALLALPALTLLLPALPAPAGTGGAMAVFQVFSTGSAGHSNYVKTGPSDAASAVPAIPASIDPEKWAIGIWAAGTAFGLAQMALGCLAVWRLRRGARRLDCRGIVETCDGVEVLESAGGGTPMTFGVLRPAVLLPAGASEWSPSRLRVVLLHELAHVRRGDVATHLLARSALALYWWNPLAWMAWREFLKERERATDDLVLRAGERASEYATHLLEVARTLQPARATAWAAIAMARRSQLEGRLMAILDSGVSRRPWGRKAQAAAVATAIALVAPFAAIRAQAPGVPPEAEAAVRAAMTQKNHEILDHAASAYEKLAKFDAARGLLESSLSIREQQGTAAYAAGLVKLGELAAKRGQSEEAASFYTKAAGLGDRPETAPALVYLGQRALGAFDRTAAEEYFGRVLKLESKGPNAGRALTWLAVMRQSSFLGQSEAELFYQRAMAADPGNPQTLTSYARYIRRQNRIAEAEELEARAKIVASTSDAQFDPVGANGVYRVGNGVSAPALLSKVEPQYTEEARAAKLRGTVLLYIEVDPDGTAQNIAIKRSLGLGLDEKAIEAIRQWRFRPGVKDGAPVTVAAQVEVNFRLL
jgi:TonB family protein